MGWNFNDLVKPKKDVIVLSVSQYNEIMRKLELMKQLKSEKKKSIK